MKRIAACALACTGLAAFGASACETPSMVDVPEGKTATMDQMVDAQKKVKQYMAGMGDYLDCVDAELKTAGDDAPDEFKSLMTKRHNDAVTEMETVAGAFNEQVRAFKAAHPQ
jgi:hypothetical protein